MTEGRFARLGLVVALFAHATLATGHAWFLPIFEASDESDHFHYACFMAQRMPEQPTVLGSEATTGRSVWDQCVLGHHPPAYYLLLGACMDLAGRGDVLPSPRVRGEPHALQFRHAHDETTHRSSEVGLVFALRLISVIAGLLSVWFTWWTARVLWPDRSAVATLAAMLLACLPQWSAAHGALDNGNLVATLSHLAVLLLAFALAKGRFAWSDAVALGFVIAAALWTKANALALFGVAGVAVAWLAWRDRARARTTLAAGAVAAALALAAYAPQAMRNVSLYGDPLGQSAHEFAFAASRLPGGSLPGWLWEGFLPSLARSFVGMFGWWRVELPGFAYVVAAGLVSLAALGALPTRSVRRPIPGSRLLLWTACLAAFAVVLRFNLTFAQPQGRYLFSAAGAFAILVAAGLDALARRFRMALPFASVIGALAFAGGILVVVAVVRPQFRLPPPEGGPFEAIAHGALRSDTPADRRDIELLEPRDGETLDAPPTFRWRAPGDAAPRTLHAWSEDGRVVLATWEMRRVDVSGGSFTMPADLWDSLPRGAVVHWNVRNVADRARGDDPGASPGSSTATLRRR